jgi:SPP1 family predicted phage head-tail adaptor
MGAAGAIGAMRERLTVQDPTPVAKSVSSLTSAGTTATATTAAAHGFVTGDWVTVAGATPAGYNGRVKITVTGATVFTYVVGAGLVTPATGTITATYVSDAQGGRAVTWTTLATVFGELVPLRGSERMQAQAIGSQLSLRFRIRSDARFRPTMRALWTPTWPPDSDEQTLEIGAVIPVDDGRTWMVLECGSVQ